VLNEVSRIDVDSASRDLKSRTLAGIPTEIGRLIYLASTRDYNTGNYYHDGLACRFSEEVASQALRTCHREIFKRLLACPLENLVEQLGLYLQSIQGRSREVISAWKKLEPYRVTIPLDSDPLAVQLFFSNLKIALAVLESDQARLQ
jgi:hypothetical protein